MHRTISLKALLE
jgi:hypothetical protein